MPSVVRYWLAPIVGASISVGAWFFIVSIHPIFATMSITGLIPTLVAGILGGFACSVVFPKFKVLSSFLVGFALALILFFLIFRQVMGPSRNPLLWYWPAWVIPSYVAGGYLGRRHWKSD
jgi:Mn2+/Fe2+ NRAMP family transporter